MAKNKNKRKQLESKRRKFEDKRRPTDGKVDSELNCSLNPFEFHRNKVKHNIIGRKLAKNELGNKGLSRNKAFNKRKNTLLEEYKQKHKSGKGVQDLRTKDNQLISNWNERNQSITKSLSDNTLLTHKGKQLNDAIDDDIRSDDEDIDLFNRPEFIESTHFGGGSDGRPKSASEVLDQIMDEKREKQMERAANIELTEKLDTEWNSVKNILRHKGVKHENNGPNEDFDILVKQLMFDSRTQPVVNVPNVAKLIVAKEDKEVPNVVKSVETLFEEMIKSIETAKNWSQIFDTIKSSTNDLLPKISDQSININILVEKYQTIIETDPTFSPNNFGYLLIGTHFKQTKLMVQLVLIEILNKTKLKSYKQIAIVLVITKILLITSNGKYIPEVFNSVLNVIRLTQKSVSNKSKVSPDLIVGPNEQKSPVFCAKYAFDETFNQTKQFNDNQIKTIILNQTLILIEEILDIYQTIPSINELISEIRDICSDIKDNCLNNQLKQMSNKLLLKLQREQPKVDINESRPKPFMLPMFEPKFDDKTNDKKDSNKKLLKKYNRELKGAKRELRKDSNFMRNTWTNELLANDRKRKDKVKQIMGDLSQQQGLYKNKKKNSH